MSRFNTLEEMEKFYYGDINADMIKKADSSTVSSTTAFWNKIYGAKVWSQINYEANAFAVIPKEPWVKTGWRLETAAGFSFPSGGTAEGAASAFTAIPDSLKPTDALVSGAPKAVYHVWSQTRLAGALQEAGVDDIEDANYKREQAAKSHVRAMSAYLVQDVDTPASNGMESLDRVASSKAETDLVSTASDPDIYGLDRSAATTYDAQVSAAASSATASLRDLTISLIDGVWASVTGAGGMPKVIITKHNTLKVWSALLEAERRFQGGLGVATVIPRSGGGAGVTPGTEVGFMAATYFGVPIIPCQDYPSTQATTRTGEVGPILFLDTDYLRVGILAPTRYMESDMGVDMITGDILGRRGMYETIGELRCYNFVAQGKIRDLK